MGVGNQGGGSNSGNKGSNHNHEHRQLIILGEQLASLGLLATEATLISVLNAIVASDQDLEILLVRDTGNGDLVVQQITNWETGVPVVSYKDVDGNVYVPVGPLEYLDPSAVLNIMLTEMLAQGLTLDDIELNTDDNATETTLLLTNGLLSTIDAVLDAIKLDTVNLDVALSTRATEATLLLVKGVLDTVKADTGLMVTDLASIEVLLTTIDSVLDTIKLDTGNLADSVGIDNTAHGVSQKGTRALGTDGANDQQIKVDTDGNVAVNVLTSTLPSGAATEATLLLANSILTTIDADTGNMVGILTAIDSVLDAIKLDTANLDVTLSSRLNTLGQKASADSAPAVLSTEQEVILDAIKTAVEGTPASTLIAFGGQLRLIGNTGFTFLGCTSVSVINVGNADGSMTAGFFGTIKPGEEQSWEAPAGSHLPSITFDATTLGAELVITFVQP